MPARIIKQPNGKYARFSTVVDDFTHVNLPYEEALELASEESGPIFATLKMANADADPNRFAEAVEIIRLVHGDEVADEALAEGSA